MVSATTVVRVLFLKYAYLSEMTVRTSFFSCRPDTNFRVPATNRLVINHPNIRLLHKPSRDVRLGTGKRNSLVVTGFRNNQDIESRIVPTILASSIGLLMVCREVG